MRITLKGFTENALFALNIFIVFLLIFGEKIAVPYWLQPLGRLHPMILHFPIVLLLLAMLLEFFRFKESYTGEKLYQNFTTGLLLTGVLLAAVTVIMGLFLSKEEGYSGSTLQWHKWTGVSIVFFSSIIYWSRNSSWYKASVAKAGAVITVLCLIVTGHYGATLTHGDNFVLAALIPAKEKVPVDKAVIFDDVVMPIFNEKCLSCHNLEKAKGSLILTDAKSMLKGGKNGKLFVPGKPEISLLLERIHLPVDDKKHMPPKSKSQLTPEEITILALWVKDNADLKKKVIELPKSDSLRVLSASLLGPVGAVEENYDFAAADESTVKKLNNNYRVIYPLDKVSPALEVNIYNRSIYKPEAVKELEPLKKQIVSLNLNNLPVKDEELKIIGGFGNLRKLNLNFTDVKGDGLKYLKSLNHLNALSLSGTKVNFGSVKQLIGMKSLKELTLWNTGLKETEIAQLQKMNKELTVIGGFKDDGKNPVKLNQPRLTTDVSIFKSSLSLQVKHPINGVQIRYTTDGSEPDSLKSLLYDKEIVIKETATLKVKAYKAGWYSSDVVSFNFYQSNYKPDSMAFLLPANEKYKSEGPKVLLDNQLGDFDVNNGKWIGFRENNMEAIMFFKQPISLKSVTLNVMRQVQAYILLPQEVEIWGGADKKSLKLLKVIKNQMPVKDEGNALLKLDAKFEPRNVSCVKIVGKNFKKLPEWHPGKGQPAWLFIDEIFLN
ncbi:cytochrome C [Pedobacter ginsengisoli]|uniref:Cytochrome C n=1 Tax=Pedobacter ginsengisoli TaxID=363852 RepID=A0A2D1U573_9SPHI|nr:c-type cytochrome domain-containing protein [Pedobacter ginsengisoli]ATP56770.1 cytochrome C [Pedobacter ginsengisoli]